MMNEGQDAFNRTMEELCKQSRRSLIRSVVMLVLSIVMLVIVILKNP